MFNKYFLIITITTIIFNVSCNLFPTDNTDPTALFTINPTEGPVDTVFDFDASGSSDAEDDWAVLQIRWDWENDGTYDTNYSTVKTATHQYSLSGTYTIKLEVKDSDGSKSTATKTVIVYNSRPTASFTVSPASGTTDTVFDFDANGSTDTEDASSILEVRWDWENDGTYDTNYSTVKTATHQYSSSGTYTVELEVKDSDGMTNTTTMTVSVYNVVTFTDASFEALIRYTLNKSSGDITDLDMETITTLDGNGWIIANISGIEYCTNITNLKLSNNQISDISLLSNLMSLQILGLFGNQIIDISSLSNLTNLTLLYLDDNQIIDISSLSTLINLSELGLSDNQIVDIQSLVQNSGIDNGDIVHLNNNPLNANSVNTYIPQLENRGVTVRYGSPTASFTFSPTEGTTDTVFDFDANGSTDTEDASSILEVRWDWENDGTYDTNYSTVKTATHQYSSSGTYTVELEVKDSDGMTNTTTMTVSVYNVVTFTDASFEALIRYTLNKSSGDITDLDMETITTLDGNGWIIANISGIEYCTNITNLKLSNNQISDISLLSNLMSLQILGLFGNQIIDISSLSNLTNLTLLYLDDNQIIDISSLSTLINLSELGLSDNQIVDIQSLVQNSGIDNGDIVHLNNNPLNANSVNTYIPQLENRGVTVHY